MILPIVLYGNSILRKKCIDISRNFADLDILISNMWETLHNSNGIGLAAPQINKYIRLFLIHTDVKKIFINAEIIDYSKETCSYIEGCLSIPEVSELIERPSSITIKYFDENFNEHIDTFTGVDARVIQHEYDHIEGKLFIDYLPMIKKKLFKSKLNNISKGNIGVKYPVIK